MISAAAVFLFFGAAACLAQEEKLSEAVPDQVIGSSVEGTVAGMTPKDGTSVILLRGCTVVSESGSRQEEQVMLYLKGGSEAGYGDRIRAQGKVKAFGRATNRGQFDSGFYYASKPGGGIFYFCSSKEAIIVQSGRSVGIRPAFLLKNRILKVFDELLPEKEAGILSAMLLGEKEELDAGISDLYKIGGISHLLAISGLHVSLIGMALYRGLRRIRCPLVPSFLLSALALATYTILTGFGISTIRASVMLCVLLGSFLCGRTYDMVSALSASALLILYSNPFALFGAGFLLSFGAIVGIGLLNPRLSVLFSLKERTGIKKRILSAVLPSISVQLVLLPIMMYFFFELPLYSVLLNLLVLPLAGFVMVSGGAGGLIGLAAALPARFILGTACLILKLYEALCSLVSMLPFSVVITGRPEIGAVFLFYAALAVIVIAAGKVRKKVLFLAPLLLLILLYRNSSALVVEFLDVGQGDGIVIRTEDGFTCVVDCGSSTVTDVGTYRLLPYLKSEGVRQVDLAAATHGDSDHLNGLTALLEQAGEPGGVRIGTLAVSDCGRDADGYRALIETALRQGIPVLYLKSGERIDSGLLSMECLHPDTDFSGEGNAASLVFWLQYRNFTALLTGDLEAEGEEAVAELLKEQLKQMNEERNDRLNGRNTGTVTLLKVAHHGSRYSSEADFLKLAAPLIAVISSGKDNRYGHPHAETLERLEECGCAIYKTAEKGAVRVETDGGRVRIAN